MVPFRVVTVGIFSGIQKQADYLDVTVLRRQRKGAMPIWHIGSGKHLNDIGEPPSAAPDQHFRGVPIPERQSSHQGRGTVA